MVTLAGAVSAGFGLSGCAWPLRVYKYLQKLLFSSGLGGWDVLVAPQPSCFGSMLVAALLLQDKPPVVPFGKGAEFCLSEALAAYSCVDLGAFSVMGLLSWKRNLPFPYALCS